MASECNCVVSRGIFVCYSPLLLFDSFSCRTALNVDLDFKLELDLFVRTMFNEWEC